MTCPTERLEYCSKDGWTCSKKYFEEHVLELEKDLKEEIRVCNTIKKSNLRLLKTIRTVSELGEKWHTVWSKTAANIDYTTWQVQQRCADELETTLDLATQTKWNVADFLKSLPDKQLKELLQAVSLIIDPLGQELIKKALESTPKPEDVKT